ncbi:MAG: hypothetical protein ACTSYR_01525 [Candidatus Odinarchaeia archaeon]
MIHNVYILDSSGIPLVSRLYGSIKVDPTLISGYISAQNSFFKEVTGQEVEMISTKDYNFWLKKIGRFMLAVVVDKDADPRLIKWRLSQIKLAFIMNLGKDTLNLAIDVASLKSLSFILKYCNINDLIVIIKSLILGYTIVIIGDKKEDVNKFIFSILGLSPRLKQAYLYEENPVFIKESIIGLTDKDSLNNFTNKQFIAYNLVEKSLRFNVNIPKLNNFDAYLLMLIIKAKKMDELTGLDFLRNNIKQIDLVIREIESSQSRLAMFNISKVINNLKINSSLVEIIKEVISVKYPDLNLNSG